MITPYHYTECGLNNIYLLNGLDFIETSRGRAISIKDIDGLHKAIGLFLVTSKKDFSDDELRFLRHEMLISPTSNVANLEKSINDKILFKHTAKGWRSEAA
jgi:hypothetical protein